MSVETLQQRRAFAFDVVFDLPQRVGVRGSDVCKRALREADEVIVARFDGGIGEVWMHIASVALESPGVKVARAI